MKTKKRFMSKVHESKIKKKIRKTFFKLSTLSTGKDS